MLLAAAVPVQAGAKPASPELLAQAAATPKAIATARAALLKKGRTFTRLSKCPVRVRSAAYLGSVKSSNRTKSSTRIVNASTFATRSKSGKCTGVLSLSSARKAGKVKASALTGYRKQLRPLLKNGTLLFRLSWRKTSGKRFSTIAAVSPKGTLLFDPLMSTFLKSVPDSRGPAPASPTAGPALRQAPGPAVTRWTWNPFGGGRCIAEDLFGFCRVRKFVNMLIFVNVYGQITAEAESASVSATLANARRRIKAEIINDGKCKKFTVETYWTSPIGSITVGAAADGFDAKITIGGIGSNGIDSEVFILCGDGSGQVV
jgi:hypothetical protein